jgi:hypothetical protein
MDRLSHAARQAVSAGKGTAETTYSHAASGNTPLKIEERIYAGGYKLYREF